LGKIYLRRRRLKRGAVEAGRGVIKIVITVAALAHSVTSALADSITCSDWQYMRLCQGPGGYTSTESRWQGMTLGQDSDGNR
jgi:hypothetical protein